MYLRLSTDAVLSAMATSCWLQEENKNAKEGQLLRLSDLYKVMWHVVIIKAN